MEDEEWRPVVGYEGKYLVSNLGRVKSVERLDTLGRRTPAQDKSTRLGKVGYPVVSLWSEGVGKTHTVHTLVSEAFIGPRPKGYDVAHEDGTRTNNKVENLRYKTRQENLLDAVNHKTNWNTAKTHCPRGHMYSGSNLKMSKSDRGRDCRACTQERTQAHHQDRPFDKDKADAIYFKRLEQNGEIHE